MRLLIVNITCGTGSTGRICAGIAQEYENKGYEVKIAYGREPISPNTKKWAKRIGNDIDLTMHGVLARLLDNQGLNSSMTTRIFLKWADDFNPDILWLHNIHGYYLNYRLLFDWIKSRPQMLVNWTLHDCWAFTGHCSYFSMAKCDGWKSGCQQCQHKDLYPKSILFCRAEKNFTEKKNAFQSVKTLNIFTPSQWLADLVRHSFLCDYPVRVVHNKIDTNVFRPIESGFKKQHGLQDKKMVLGVADGFGKRKGLNDFICLSKMLPPDYVIVLVGLTENEIKMIPSNVIGIKRTRNVQELVEIYSAADVFVNATYEDNYPTTNLEAQACGTPCPTYRSGGSPESVLAENVVDVGDIEALCKRIIAVVNTEKT